MILYKFCLAFSIGLLSAVNAARVPVDSNHDAIPDSYIVMMKTKISAQRFATHRDWVKGVHHESLSKRENQKATGGLKHVYDLGTLKGYSGTFDKTTIQKIADNPDVDYIERDGTIKGFAINRCSQPNAPSWGLGRISHRKAGSREYVYDCSAGEGITIYLPDTGCDASHPDVSGRVTWGTNVVDDTDKDENGHGSFLCGLLVGKTSGVAKKAKLVVVKVLNGSGSGTTSGMIAGIDWIISDAKAKGILGNTVMNISWGGGYSQALNSAVEKAVQAGVFTAVAVGGSNVDARNTSPASANGVCAVAASTSSDSKATFSDYGKIVDIFAPGQNIVSIRPGGGSNTMSGTSLAAPHVAGVGAYLIRLEGVTSGKLCDRIKELGTPIVKNPGPGTTDLLLYNGSGE